MLWKQFFDLWTRLLSWERKFLIAYARLALADRALLPAMTYQAGAVGIVMLLTPRAPLLWSLAFVVLLVYALMIQAVTRR